MTEQELREIIRKELTSLNEKKPDYAEASYQMDKWLPGDNESIKEFQRLEDAKDIDGLADYLEGYARDRVQDYGLYKSKHFKELAKYILKEGVDGYEVGPDLDDFDGMDFNGASSAIPWDTVYDDEDFEDVLKYVSKYKSKIKKFGIKSDKDMENFAKWMSSGFHAKSESTVVEGAPKMRKNEEAEHLQNLMNQVANAQKGGMGSRYGKEFDKAKTKALRALKDMVDYSKIGV